MAIMYFLLQERHANGCSPKSGRFWTGTCFTRIDKPYAAGNLKTKYRSLDKQAPVFNYLLLLILRV